MPSHREAALSTPTTALRPTSPAPSEAILVTSDLRDVVRFLHDIIGLSDNEISESTGGVHEVTVRRWRSKASGGSPRRVDHIDDLRAIVGLLLNSRLLYPEEIGRFLRSRNPELDYSRPLTVLGEGGRFDDVRRVAERLLSRMRGLEHDEEDTSSPEQSALPDGITRPPVIGTHRPARAGHT